MKKFLGKFIVISSLLIGLASCEEMVSDVEIESSPSKIVVTGFLNPDMPYIYVNVTRSRPLYDTIFNQNSQYEVVEDAFLTITDGTDSAYLSFDIQTYGYVISREQFPVIKGKTYHIFVTTPGGDSAYASTTVPDFNPPDIESINLDTTFEYSSEVYHANFKFKDIKGPGHFYSVRAGGVYWNIDLNRPDLIDIGLDRGDYYVVDKNKDGDYFTYSTNSFSEINEQKITRLYFTIAVTDEHYYKYHKALENFEEGNPFAEPVPVYSNVHGGLGVFGSYIQEGTPYDWK